MRKKNPKRHKYVFCEAKIKNVDISSVTIQQEGGLCRYINYNYSARRNGILQSFAILQCAKAGQLNSIR